MESVGRWVTVSLCLLGCVAGIMAGTESDATVCSQLTNTSCEQCLKNVKCLWCSTDNECMVYPLKKLLPPASICKLSSARWGVCWVNFEALIIAMSVVGGIIILSICICCYCCCCRKKKKSRSAALDNEKALRQQEERKVRQEERRVQMKTRHDEIRKKYGLFKEDNPYSKFEA
ncbi:pituitary tumor-transforming gene 1 -interacting [Pelobates cultripes]|uniref:Pituitary tumor-transforming gene 1 -interacting n=1 Tax=Pelobates cultripes TaxID=61616 RepID=A0AAD1WCZ7_PELCU|nr:pituitary tumor-transforming gene 1 -interacting [Pelobates cultripes]